MNLLMLFFMPPLLPSANPNFMKLPMKKTRFNMDKNEMKIVEAKTIADVCNTLSEILEELKKIHDVLQRRDQK